MQNIGDVVIGDRIGRRPRDKYMWCACKYCGGERWVRIVHRRPRSVACRICANKPQNAPNYWGGRMTHNGYKKKKLYRDDPFYPMVAAHDYVMEHRLVMAKHLGRCLQRWELVHHINGVKTDNRIENLQLVSDDTHKSITMMEQHIKELEKRITLLEAENILIRSQNLAKVEIDKGR